MSKQEQLNRAVANATGESIGLIRRRGFGLEMPLEELDDEPVIYRLPQYVDWDSVEQQRLRAA